MKDLLLYIARNLVENPDAVSVTETENGDELTLELRVAPEDMGKVIGRQGRIAKEIRTLVRSCAQRTGQKVTVDIVDSNANEREDQSRGTGPLFRLGGWTVLGACGEGAIWFGASGGGGRSFRLRRRQGHSRRGRR